jgi:hypothetical protein
MGLAAGGVVSQPLVADPFGSDTWQDAPIGRVFVHIVNSETFRDITGLDPPPTPITAETYAELGVPWFEHYRDRESDDRVARQWSSPVAPNPEITTVCVRCGLALDRDETAQYTNEGPAHFQCSPRSDENGPIRVE